MAAPLLPLPLSALREVIEASAGLVDVAKDLASVAEGVKDPALQRRLEIEISRILDYADRISGAIRSFSS